MATISPNTVVKRAILIPLATKEGEKTVEEAETTPDKIEGKQK